jgi:TP901 family phage tail tape measure protein
VSDTSLVFNLLAVDKVSGILGGVGMAFGSLKAGLVVGGLEAGAAFVKLAGDFQFGITRLETGAGEAHSNLKLVSDGILQMATQVGESTKDLNAGMYLVESAGYHGADGLNVLKNAAMGAKVGNADMATVADAVTTALNAYGMGAKGAAAATNALVAAEGQGKTNLEALAGSLSTVAPIAALAHISLNEVLGAMATMTAQGTPAANAATYLRQAIGQLSAPSGKAAQEMHSLGLNAVDVSQNLGKNGLASTLDMLTDAIQRKMGPAGTVLIEHLRKASAQSNDFQKVLAGLPPDQQTFIGALADMTGGVKAMQAALQLTGPHMADFRHNTEVINEKVKAGGTSIEGWTEVQKTFNQKLSEAKAQVEVLSVRIGTALMPVALGLLHIIMNLVSWLDKHRAAITGVVGVIQSVVNWFKQHKAIAEALVITIGALVVVTKAHQAAMAVQAAGGFASWLGKYLASIKLVQTATKVWTAVQWALNVAMDANIVGLIILAVVALVAGIYLLWTHSAAFRNFFIGLWQHIWGFLKVVGAWFAGPFANFFVGVWHVIATAALWFWHNVISPFVSFFVTAWHGIADTVNWLWRTVLYPMWQGFKMEVNFATRIIMSFVNLFLFGARIVWSVVWNGLLKPVFTGIAAAAVWLYNSVIMPVVRGVVLGWQLVAAGATWLYQNAILPVVHGIATAAVWLWQNGIMPVVHFLDAAWHAIAAGALWLWHQAIEPVINGVVGVFKWGWGILHAGFDLVMDKVRAVGRVFSDIFSAISGYISSAFHGAVATVKGAINGMIGLLNSAISFINGNVIDVANKAPGVNFPHIPHIPYLARGGDVTRGGLAVVGEEGAEVVSLPSGSRVHPNGAGPGVAVGRSEMRVTGNTDGAFATALKQLIRTGQIVFYDSAGQRISVA